MLEIPTIDLLYWRQVEISTMKRVLIFLGLLIGLVSIGLAMYGRGVKSGASSRPGADSEGMHARSLPRSRVTVTF
jgi:hypothetical protein